MAHVRSQIRDAFVTVLTGLTTSGTRVFPSRIHVLRDVDLPCLLVNLDNEEIEAATMHANPLLERSAELKVRACAKVVANLDDTLDTMVAEVEAAIAGAADQSFGGLIKPQALPSSLEIDFDESLEKPVGVATLTYRITYFTAAASPATAL